MKKKGYFIVEDDQQFGYLLGMHIRSFTKQKLEEFKRNITKLEKELEIIKQTTEQDMWKHDIDQFMKEYNK
jgi:hypothetical protein